MVFCCCGRAFPEAGEHSPHAKQRVMTSSLLEHMQQKIFYTYYISDRCNQADMLILDGSTDDISAFFHGGLEHETPAADSVCLGIMASSLKTIRFHLQYIHQ